MSAKILSASKARTIVLVLLALSAPACWFLVSCSSDANDIRNVILISIDTCRADHLGCYGNTKQTTPNIDELAQESILFSNVYTTVPQTLPAHSTMLTGTIPPHHGVHDNIGYKLDQTNMTLAEILGRNEFTTAAVISSYVLDSKFGLKQGFTYYDDLIEKSDNFLTTRERIGEETNRIAFKWLDRHKHKRFFFLLHYYDPHKPCEPPEPFASKFSEDSYAGEIAYTDYCIGKFIKKLKDLGIYDSTLIIVTSDHGEMLGEHGEITHSYFIYESALKVPLIFKLPGHNKAAKIDDPVGLIDIVPTICSLLEIKVPSNIQGKTLLPHFSRKKYSAPDRYLYCESLYPTKYKANSLLGIVTNRWKFIQTTRPELYDLSADPGETNNLIEQQPNRARILRDRLKQILENSVRKDTSGNKAMLDEKDRTRLETLGYLASATVNENFEFDQSNDDPKDLIDFHRLNSKGIMLINLNHLSEAKALYVKMLKEYHQYSQTHYRLADIASKQNEFDEAIKHLTIALRISPDSAEINLAMGSTLVKLGRFDEAIEHFYNGLKINPMYASAHEDLGTIFTLQGNIKQAIHHFEESIRINPENAKSYKNLGDMMMRQGNIQEAIVHYNKAVELKPDFKKAKLSLGEAHFIMGSMLLGKRELNEAIKHLQKALQKNNDSAKAHTHLGYALLAQGKEDESLKHCYEAVRIDPERSLNAYYNLACIYAKRNKIEESVDWLKRAIDKGFNNWELIKTDKDLEGIRTTAYYIEITNKNR